MTLTYLPWRRPTAYDERPCVRDERIALDYRGFAVRVEAAAEHLAAQGVRRGSVVAVMLPNQVELLVVIMAAWRLGAAATPVNPTFTATESGHQISDSGAVLVIDRDNVADLPTEPAGTLPPAETAPGDLALLVYTSGSTGRPKGVMLDHGNLAAMISGMGEGIRAGADDHCLLVLPLFHVNAICVSFLTPMSVGAQLTVLQRFHPVEFLGAIERYRPTYFSAVPTIYSHLVALPAEFTADVSSVRFAICGAAPAPPELFAAVEKRFGFPLVEGYGLSEGTCASTCNPVDGVRKPGTVGPALPGQLVAIMAPDGALLPAGERGEVVVKGDNVMRGYLNRPEATAEVLGDGWLHTGDVGILDEDGYLRIVDRIKDMIIRGGENIYPKEIENVLHGGTGVLEASVVGGADSVYGEVPVAFVAPEPGAVIDVDVLLARCREELTKIKVPVVVHVLDALPKNPVGKIDKPALRARLAATTSKES
ncbi:AMP-binding protein [Nocardioides sp. WV_118_6]|uniref:class I adenylate-forming enzyme family protein n=1 Tax=Nocardioides simplex TaxID=2045 RepID=UPI00214F6258|nr:AMP-binding protein [Pimelobacter simplex]UUW92000.1 AMP-binding protein [Pimelobacter simplex]UUW95827.1 AMP-binding protein [Pimelobacter simplex]